MDLGSLRDRPGQKPDLVDEVVDRRVFAQRRQRASDRGRIRREAVDHRVVVQAQVGRCAVVHQGPDHLQAMAFGALRDAPCARKVPLARSALGQTPTDALAHAAQAARGGVRIVLVEAAHVGVAVGHVERQTVGIDMVGALVATHPERTERKNGISHVK